MCDENCESILTSVYYQNCKCVENKFAEIQICIKICKFVETIIIYLKRCVNV